MNQMQLAAGTQASTPDVAGVPMDFRRHEDNMTLYFRWKHA
jgi:hypothetical protein